jgi:protein-L-isoaspartate(D-aspartate) O-methyltransferase
MTQTDARTGIEAESSSKALRERMIAELIESDVLTDPAIEAAFRVVPREVFAPAGTPAELPYAINDVVETRFTDDGNILSSLSAPVMHAGNLHQARVRKGQRVLEIGSGLYRLHSVAARTWPRRACVGGRDFDALAAAAVGSGSGGSVRG